MDLQSVGNGSVMKSAKRTQATDALERQDKRDLSLMTRASARLHHGLPNEDHVFEVRRQGFSISTDRSRLDIDLVCRFLLEESHWAREFSEAMLLRALRSSLLFGLYAPDGRQIGFARAITDFSLFCYLCDVFVLASYRDRGLGTWLSATVLKHPDLASVPTWMLKTSGAHRVYARVGFGPLEDASLFMQFRKKVDPPAVKEAVPRAPA